ncbi:MAG: hypothetical protein K2Y37_18465 [Pirellulales bacterium]|nr:hypothetical protein [Pirellulales bacterium]
MVRFAVLLGVRAVVAERLLVVGAGRVAVAAGRVDLPLATVGAFWAGRAAYVAPLLPAEAVQVPSGQHDAGAAQLSQSGAAQAGGAQQEPQQRRRQPRAEASLVNITKATSPTPAIIQAFFIVQVSIVEVSYPPYKTDSLKWSASRPVGSRH